MTDDMDDNTFVFDAIEQLLQHGEASFQQQLLQQLAEVQSNHHEFLIIAVELAIDQGQYDAGMDIINNLLAVAAHFPLDAKSAQGMCYLSRSDIHSAYAEYQQAKLDIERAIPLFEQVQDYYNLAECYSQLANGLDNEPQQAIQLLTHANLILRQLRKSQPVSSNAFVQNYGSLANIYSDQGHSKKADKYYRIAPVSYTHLTLPTKRIV